MAWTVLVTGGSSGIGQELAKRFGLHGPFAETDVEKLLDVIRVDVLALTCLSRVLVPDMQRPGPEPTGPGCFEPG